MGNAKSIANSVIFPAPQPSVRAAHPQYDHKLPDLIWVPKKFAGRTQQGEKIPAGSFPVLFIPAPRPSSLFFIYLHANCCDIGLIKPELYDVSEGLGANVVAVEYPGYGISPEIQVTTGPAVDLRVIATFYFLLSVGVQPSSIVFFGRSIGTGPAAAAAAHFSKKGIECGGVILQAPYVSIHKIVQGRPRARAEYFPLASWLVDNFWDTEQALREMAPKVPLLVIHGLLDEIVPVAHGQRLFEGYESALKMADFQPKSKHNYYSIREVGRAHAQDLIAPIQRFVEAFKIAEGNPPLELALPSWCFYTPKSQPKKRPDSERSTPGPDTARSLGRCASRAGPKSSRTSSVESRANSGSARSSGTASARLQESTARDLGADVNRNICYSNFSSSLEGLCQRNSISSDEISDIVNDAITRNNP